MNKSTREMLLSFVFLCSLSAMAGEVIKVQSKDVSTIKQIFEEGKASGEIRTMYAGYNQRESGEADTYATALGGYLKYETAELNGFGAAVAFATSHDLGFATGDKGVKQNDELSSSDGEYSALSEAYVNYRYDDFNFRAGRQIIDTPLADSDDIRMVQNTFEALIATYETSGFYFMAGKLEKWQGYDAGLDEGWVKAGEEGTYFGGAVYSDDTIEANGWFYHVTGVANAAYFDAALNNEIRSGISVLGALQYLSEQEIDGSGTEADIYGVLAELCVNGFTLSAAYNKSQKKVGKASFSGFGGGALFTSMDTMILDNISKDREAASFVASAGYTFEKADFLYAYGDFYGKADSSGVKEHIIEQNIGFGYSVNDALYASVMYAIDDYKRGDPSTTGMSARDNLRLMLAYSF